MNLVQYANLVIQLSAVGQRSDAFDGLEPDELRNLVFLLAAAHDAAAAKAGPIITQEAALQSMKIDITEIKQELPLLKAEIEQLMIERSLYKESLERIFVAYDEVQRREASASAFRVVIEQIRTQLEGETK